MHQDTIPVGEAARRAGLSAKAVRLYEAIGILAPVARTPSGYRAYTLDEVELLRFVRRARALGLSLDEIRRLVEAGRRDVPPCESVIELLERHVDATGVRLAQLARTREVLSGLLERARERSEQDESVRLCRLVREDDRA